MYYVERLKNLNACINYTFTEMFQVEKLVSDPIVMFFENKICLNYIYGIFVVF